MSDGVQRTEQQVFADLQRLCGSPGYIHVLAYISYRDNMISYEGELEGDDVSKSYALERTIRTEFTTLVGLMLQKEIDCKVPHPEEFQNLVDRTQELLAELHDCLNSPVFELAKRSFDAGREVELEGDWEDPFLHGDVLREPIFYGGDSAYSFQYREFALERYKDDEKWLQENRGFSIVDAHTVSEAITRLQEEKIPATIRDMRTLDPALWTILPGFTFTLDEVASEAGLERCTASAVLSSLTAPMPPGNKNFASLGDFNIASALPVLHMPDGSYVSFGSYGVVEALYEGPFYWMMEDKTYRDRALAHRGLFTEELVAKRLEAVFSPSNVHRNVSVLKGREHVSEVDVLVLFADRALVVQCKSKRLTLEARRGNDLQIRDDFKKSVHDAYDQALVCAKSLCDSTLKFVSPGGSEIEVPRLKSITPVCVVSDHYPALTTQARSFLSYETSRVIEPPLVGDVFLIDVLAEMLESPLRFLSYLHRRVNYERRIVSTNELVILALHLRQNLWVDSETDLLVVGDDMAVDLDTAMMVRREGLEGERTPAGPLTLIEGSLIGRVLQSVENSAEPALIELGFMLLTLSSESLNGLSDGIAGIARQTRQDGRNHDLTAYFAEGDTGLTVHCGTITNVEAADKLAHHCQLRKYAHKASSWFGLVVRSEDGLPKFGVSFNEEWEQNDALDEATDKLLFRSKPKPLARHGSHAATRKVGRNAPCPCGSGKKFKKCCLDKLSF